MSRVVITEFMEEASVERLARAHDVVWDDTLVDRRDALLEAVAGADAIIVRNRTQVDAELVAAAPALRAVGRLGVGLDNIDMQACAARDIAVLPAVGANAASVAEYVIGAAFVLVRGVFHATAEVVEGQWRKQALGNGGELAGRTMGLVGYGGIGREVAVRARALGMHVVAHDPAVREADVELVSLDDILARADVVSLHIPLIDATRNLFDAGRIAAMKSGAVLIDTARGGIVDEPALAGALRSGHLGGAALDVFAQEPAGETARVFEGEPNLILTPHIAGLSAEGNVRVSEATVDNVMRALAG